MASAEPNLPATSTNKIAIRVLQFWAHDETKYGYVIRNIKACYTTGDRDIIILPPIIEKYNKLQVELIIRLQSIQERKKHVDMLQINTL